MIKIFPSLISGNLLCIEQSIKQLEAHCDGFHVDVMDNHFVPNMTFGPDMVNAIAQATSKLMWVHLMVDDPADWCTSLRLRQGSIVSFHFEATRDADHTIKCITEKKWVPSVAISPKTNAAEIFSLLNTIDHVLVMSVNPGFSGQRFLANALPKVSEILEQAESIGKKIIVGMDGGVNKENIQSVAAAGVQDIAIASAIFDSDDPVRAIEDLRAMAQK